MDIINNAGCDMVKVHRIIEQIKQKIPALNTTTRQEMAIEMVTSNYSEEKIFTTIDKISRLPKLVENYNESQEKEQQTVVDFDDAVSFIQKRAPELHLASIRSIAEIVIERGDTYRGVLNFITNMKSNPAVVESINYYNSIIGNEDKVAMDFNSIVSHISEKVPKLNKLTINSIARIIIRGGVTQDAFLKIIERLTSNPRLVDILNQKCVKKAVMVCNENQLGIDQTKFEEAIKECSPFICPVCYPMCNAHVGSIFDRNIWRNSMLEVFKGEPDFMNVFNNAMNKQYGENGLFHNIIVFKVDSICCEICGFTSDNYDSIKIL